MNKRVGEIEKRMEGGIEREIGMKEGKEGGMGGGGGEREKKNKRERIQVQYFG